MPETLDRLTFEKMWEVGGADAVLCGAFMNEVLECVFIIPRESRGMVERIVPYFRVSVLPQDTDFAYRAARVHFLKDQEQFYFYIFAQSRKTDYQKWKILGRSVALNGPIRMPNYETEMYWF